MVRCLSLNFVGYSAIDYDQLVLKKWRLLVFVFTYRYLCSLHTISETHTLSLKIILDFIQMVFPDDFTSCQLKFYLIRPAFNDTMLKKFFSSPSINFHVSNQERNLYNDQFNNIQFYEGFVNLARTVNKFLISKLDQLI
jgi:hypothetical protein